MANDFDFDSWISYNKLDAIKNALLSLEFNNLAKLQVISEPLIDFILSSHQSLQSLHSDQRIQYKTLLINALKPLSNLQTTDHLNNGTNVINSSKSPKNNDIINNNNNNNTSSSNISDKFLIITHEENKVLQSLKNKMKDISEYETKFNLLEKEYEYQTIKSQKLYMNEIKNIENEINDIFKLLIKSIQDEKQLLLNKINKIKQNHFNINDNNNNDNKDNNNDDQSLNINNEIKSCFQSLQIQKKLLNNSISKYKDIMTSSTQSSKKLMEFNDDLKKRQTIIREMGESVEKQFNLAINKWDNIILNINESIRKEFHSNFKHFTFLLADDMRKLISHNYLIGIINKIGSTNINDCDWIDNGSLVLYIKPPIMIINDNNTCTDINNLKLKQYKIRYRYVVKDDNIDDNKKDVAIDDMDDDDKLLLNELDKQEALLWNTTAWVEMIFNNDENEFLSTIPLKIDSYKEDILLNDINLNIPQKEHLFVYICQYMEIQLSISCQFKLIKQSMSFWTEYSQIYNVNQNNIVLNGNIKIDDNTNNLIISNGNNNNMQMLDQKEMDIVHHNDINNGSGNGIVNINGSQFQLPQLCDVSQLLGNNNNDNNDINDSNGVAGVAVNNNNNNDKAGSSTLGDTLLLSSGMVRAWRYDDEQDKWRGRGKGNLMLYRNNIYDYTKIVFKDVKHENKVRLLQHINSEYQHCKTNFAMDIEWMGADWSMDLNEPLKSLWKLKFIDEPDKVQQFTTLFNNAVDKAKSTRNIQYT